jgi:hypothetical protein
MWFMSSGWEGRMGQLGESGEYRMGRSRVESFHVQSSECGSPRLSQLRTDLLAPVSKFDYVLAHSRFMGSHKLSSFVGCRDRSYPSRMTSG